MSKHLDYFKDHPASPDSRQEDKDWKQEVLEKETWMLDKSEFAIGRKYEYLLKTVKKVMFMTNAQAIKDKLGETIDALENQ